MVNFFDPVQQLELSYHIDSHLLEKWNKLKDGRLIKKDEDRVYLVDGRERTGKSVFTFQQAKYIDPTFNLSRVCFTPEEFLKAVRTADKGQVVVFDEAFRGLSSKAGQSKVNKSIVQAMMEMGQRNLVIFIVLPTFFLLEMYAAVLRSNCLFHVYKDKNGNRKFRIYNFNQKSILYQVGKKKGFSYKWPRVKVRGAFYNKYAIEEASYRNKKTESFEHTEFKEEEEENIYYNKYQKLIYAFRKMAYKYDIDNIDNIDIKNLKELSEIKTAKLLKSFGIEESDTNIGTITRKVRNITPIPTPYIY